MIADISVLQSGILYVLYDQTLILSVESDTQP